MRVSVVIPCHNSLRYLPETLDSVVRQELDPRFVDDMEVVLVDDGGDDDLAGWLERSGHRTEGSGRVRVVRQENAGVSAARNRGIAESTGGLIAFCDSDDLWMPGMVSALAKRFHDDPAIGLAYGWYEVVNADLSSTGSIHRTSVSGDAWEELILDNPISASGVMVSRATLDDVGGFAENRDRFPIDVEDWELWIRIAARWPVAVVPEVVALHRRHESNSSTDIESLERAYEHLMEVVFEGVPPERATLRRAAQARYKVILAWQSLNEREDPAAARAFLLSAVRDRPEIRRTPEYWRLRAAAGVLGVVGSGGYRVMRSVNQAVRRSRNRPR